MSKKINMRALAALLAVVIAAPGPVFAQDSGNWDTSGYRSQPQSAASEKAAAVQSLPLGRRIGGHSARLRAPARD
jgi:hypothetical protein